MKKMPFTPHANISPPFAAEDEQYLPVLQQEEHDEAADGHGAAISG